MTKFVSNVNAYLSEMKIKQTYLSLISGIDKNKLSRILTGAQEENGSDMERIASALGKTVEFFLQDTLVIPDIRTLANSRIAFYAGSPSKKQEKVAALLMELMENIDEVMSAKSRFDNVTRG